MGSGNGLLPDMHQAITWTDVDFSLVRFFDVSKLLSDAYMCQ